MNFTAIDFETANNGRDSACAVGVVKVADGQIVTSQSWLINPQTYFLKGFTDGIHGITAEMVEDAPLFNEAWREVVPLFAGSDFIVAHNAGFDRTVMNKCCERYKIVPPELPFHCSVKIAKQHWQLEHASLDLVCDMLDIELNHHEALSDATACAKIVMRAVRDGFVI